MGGMIDSSTIPVTTGNMTVYPNTGQNTGDLSWLTWYYPPRVEVTTPRDCAGDIHVFPCPHCDKCKCGGATKAKAKR